MFSAALLAIACLLLVTLAVLRRVRSAVDSVIMSTPLVGLVGMAALSDAELEVLQKEAAKLPELRTALEAAIKRADAAAGAWGTGPESRIKGLETELLGAKQARDELEKRYNARIDEIETRMNRPGGAGSHAKESEVDALARKEFVDYVRKGITPKTLATNDGANGGFLLPKPMVGRMIEELVQISPIRAHANALTITEGDALDVPRDEGSFTAGWVGEGQARAATSHSTFAQVKVQLREQYALVKSTQRMLDIVPDIEGFISRKQSQIYAKKEGLAFLLGDNVNEPEGLMGNADVTTVKTGHASEVKADGLLDLIAALPTEYAPGAKLFMNRKTKYALRKLKDSQNRYLWEPGLPGANATPGSGLTQGIPDTFAGVPIVETPDIVDVAANTKSILYTDWRLSYQIVDKPVITVLRDPFTDKPNVLFYGTRYVGGRVVNPKAAKIQKTEA